MTTPHTSLDMRDSWINGRTLKLAVAQTGARHGFGAFGVNDKVLVDTDRDAYLLGAEFAHPFPFTTGQGVMATVRDTGHAPAQVYELAQFSFTASAFQSALHWVQIEDAKTDINTQALEVLGQRIVEGTEGDVYEFSRQVCQWGRGERVWGNLERHYTRSALTDALRQWVAQVAQAHNPAEAVQGGIAIKGLGVSFASKHLRFLAPSRYAVLDAVLSDGLGYALNPAGYGLFMHALSVFKRQYNLPHSLAHIEWALFGLVRQSVRSQHFSDSTSSS